MDSQVLAISTDFVATLSHWSKELNADFPMLSDHDRKVSELYGVLNPQYGIANRTTFVIDKDGKIDHIDENREALDPTKAQDACSRLSHRAQK